MTIENERLVDSAFVKSPRMLIIEREYSGLGSSIDEIVNRAYHAHRSITEAARAIDVSRVTFYKWTKLFSVPIPRVDPEVSAKRTQALRLTYATRGEEIVANIHAGDSDKKRRKTLTSIWARTLPEERSQLGQKIVEIKREKLGETLRIRLQGDPIEIIRDMHFRQRLSLKAIAEQTGFAPDTIKRYVGSEIEFKHLYKTGPRKNFAKHQEIARKAQQSGLLEFLSERQRTIIEGRFLRDEDQPLSSSELGEQFGVSMWTIYFTESKILKALQQVLSGEISLDGFSLRITRKRGRPRKDEKFPDFNQSLPSQFS